MVKETEMGITKEEFKAQVLACVHRIRVNPWDDAERMILADWIDEHGAEGARERTTKYLRGEFTLGKAVSASSLSFSAEGSSATKINIDKDNIELKVEPLMVINTLDHRCMAWLKSAFYSGTFRVSHRNPGNEYEAIKFILARYDYANLTYGNGSCMRLADYGYVWDTAARHQYKIGKFIYEDVMEEAQLVDADIRANFSKLMVKLKEGLAHYRQKGEYPPIWTSTQGQEKTVGEVDRGHSQGIDISSLPAAPMEHLPANHNPPDQQWPD